MQLDFVLNYGRGGRGGFYLVPFGILCGVFWERGRGLGEGRQGWKEG